MIGGVAYLPPSDNSPGPKKYSGTFLYDSPHSPCRPLGHFLPLSYISVEPPAAVLSRRLYPPRLPARCTWRAAGSVMYP